MHKSEWRRTPLVTFIYLAIAVVALMYLVAPQIQSWKRINFRQSLSNASLAGPSPPLKEAWKVSGNSEIGDLTMVNGQLATRTRKARKAFDPLNGKIIWSKSLSTYIGIAGTTAYAFDSEVGVIESSDLVTGRVKWRRNQWITPAADPVLTRGTVLIGGQQGAEGLFLALDEKTGHLKWLLKTPMPITTEPIVIGDTVVFGTMGNWKAGGPSALLVSARIKTGRERWVTPLDGSILTPGVRKKALFLATAWENRINKVDLNTGDQIWSFDVGGEVEFMPALAEDVVVVATADGTVKAYEISDGKVRWTAKMAGPTAQPPVAANGFVYLARAGKKPAIVVVDAEKGAIISTHNLRAAPTTGLVIDKGRLFVGIGDSELIALEGK